MDDNSDIHDPQEKEEETLSLSDFPITPDEADDKRELPNFQDRRSSSEPTDFFEFFNHLNPQMSHAEDIIFCGKLMPLNKQPLPHHQTQKPTTINTNKQQSFHSRRSESMPELNTKTQLTRTSRSLDSQKLSRNSSMSSETADISRNSSAKSSGKVLKPRWYIMMFGFIKFPPEMDLRDIKSRQVRRSQASFVPALDGGNKVMVKRSDRKSYWGLLKVLSCKDHASVAVTASFGCIQQV